MGKILQIRVSAWTYREEDVEEAWPALVRLAWEHETYLEEKHGVLELVSALSNGLLFENWPEKTASALRAGIATAVSIKNQLETALSDWEPREANKLSDALEDALTALNQLVP
ncbi:MAG: formin-like protein 18 [Bilophila sp.]